MNRQLYIEPYLSERQANQIIDALRSSKGDAGPTREDLHLAHRIEHNLANARREFVAAEIARAATEQERSERAANHVLTKTQAEALAAVRVGQGPYSEWANYGGSLGGRWKIMRSMGGARRRMVSKLIEEGLLTERRELTDAGRVRLEEWEKAHPRLAGWNKEAANG